MTLAEYIRLTLLEQPTEAEKKAWKKLRREHRGGWMNGARAGETLQAFQRRAREQTTAPKAGD